MKIGYFFKLNPRSFLAANAVETAPLPHEKVVPDPLSNTSQHIPSLSIFALSRLIPSLKIFGISAPEKTSAADFSAPKTTR